MLPGSSTLRRRGEGGRSKSKALSIALPLEGGASVLDSRRDGVDLQHKSSEQINKRTPFLLFCRLHVLVLTFRFANGVK